jgi:hypothetical protein
LTTKDERLRTAADFKTLAASERHLARTFRYLLPDAAARHDANAAEHEAAADEILAEMAADDVFAPRPGQ